MEHLLAPPSSQPIKVPYVGIQEFDAGELLVPDNVLVFFKSYLDRNRWVRDRATANVIFTNRSPEDIARCFQTWLYFGCIISVFRLLNVIIRTRDLLSGSYGLNEVLVDTTRLHGYIAEAAKREGFAQGPTVQDFASQKYMRGQNIKEMLNMTFLYLPMYSKESDSMPEPFKSRMRLIELSIMAMGETLCNVLVAIYGDDFRDMPNWGCSPILEDRLRQNGWCISDSPFFPESLQRSAISAAYYFGGYACPRPPKDHSTCSPAICNGYLQVINAGTYVQKHVSPSCSCTDIKVPTAARDIVKRQTIPVIHWNGTRLNVRESTPHTIYVALSHVWSDGLGNDDITNSLPTCQLSRIQRLVNNLYAENNPSSDYDYVPTGRLGNELIPFWIDTLCVPVGDGKERKDAIKMMAEIYRRADKVLVLDSFILSLPCSADVVEKYLRIHLSKWHHRLWTMQEGQLASNLFFQFDGGAESFSDMSYNERLRLNVCDPAILSSPLQLLCTTELDAFYRYFEQARPDYGANITTRMRSCAKYLRSRQTSRYSDEPVCIANILGLASEEILKVKDPIERMATFYELVRDFDPRIIFHEHPRLPLEGFGWAPRSFLHQVPDLIAIRQGGLHLDGQSLATKLIPGGGGLPIQFPGFELVGRLQPLLAGSWGFIRAWVGGDYRFPTQWSYENATPWWSCTYKVEVLPEVEGVNTVYEDGASRYAVILPTSIHPSAMTDPGVTGILGKVDPSVPETPKGLPLWVWTTSHGSSDNHKPAFFVQYMLPVRYVCRVRVSMPSPTVVPQGSAFTWALCFREEQQWSLR